MKSMLMILIALLLISSTAPAQFIKGYGLKIGAASANQIYDNVTFALPIEARWGFDAGIFIEALNIPYVSLLGEIHYVQKGFSSQIPVFTPSQPDGNGQFTPFRPRLDYIAVPLLVKVRFDMGTFTPYIFAGPRVDFLLTNTDNGFGFILGRKFNQIDAGASMGIGIDVRLWTVPDLLAEVRYSPSFTEAFRSESITVKNTSVELLVGVQL